MAFQDKSVNPAQRRAFGQWIVAGREARGMTRRQLAKIIGISETAVAHYETAINYPATNKPHIIPALEAALGSKWVKPDIAADNAVTEGSSPAGTMTVDALSILQGAVNSLLAGVNAGKLEIVVRAVR